MSNVNHGREVFYCSCKKTFSPVHVLSTYRCPSGRKGLAQGLQAVYGTVRTAYTTYTYVQYIGTK